MSTKSTAKADGNVEVEHRLTLPSIERIMEAKYTYMIRDQDAYYSFISFGNRTQNKA